MNFTRSITIIGLVSTLLLVSCSKSAAEESAKAPAVDPRFETAESTLREYNALATHDPVNMAAVLDMFYAENDLQRQIVALERSATALSSLDHAMFDRFQEGWNAKAKHPMDAPDQPAHFKKIEPQRAEAEFISSNN